MAAEHGTRPARAGADRASPTTAVRNLCRGALMAVGWRSVHGGSHGVDTDLGGPERGPVPATRRTALGRGCAPPDCNHVSASRMWSLRPRGRSRAPPRTRGVQSTRDPNGIVIGADYPSSAPRRDAFDSETHSATAGAVTRPLSVRQRTCLRAIKL